VEVRGVMILNKEKIWQIVLSVLSVAAFVSVFSYAIMWHVYWDRLPRSADKVAGRVYADNFHGVIVYETREESFRLHALENASLALVVITIMAAATHHWIVQQAEARKQ
jgi:hypothetical protein